MSTKVSNLPKSNLLNHESLNFFVKIEDRLFPIIFKLSQTAKDLKIFIESSFNISPSSYFLNSNIKILNDANKIGLKIKKDSIIRVCFKQLGGMIDPPYSAPLYGLEVILLNQTNQPILGTVLDPLNNPKNLPTNLVCRIYTDAGNGTGFGIKTARGKTLIITAKHVISSPFGEATLIAACFETDQLSFGRIIIEEFKMNQHKCRPSIQALRPVNFDFLSFENQVDLITREFYSIHNDIVALEPTGHCICGNPNQVPDIPALKLAPTPKKNSSIVFLGFPGQFTDPTKVFSVPVQNSDFILAKQMVFNDTAMYTEGEVLKKGAISCISAASFPGMSGSPMLWLNEGEWKIAGMLVGGPALRGHRKLLEVLEAFNKGETAICQSLIDEMMQSSKKRLRKIAKKLKKKYRNLLGVLKKLYFKEIDEERYEIFAEGRDPKILLNHNLVYDCFSFISSLVN